MSIYSYINTRGSWANSKLYENTPPFGRRVSTQFLVFPISTRVDITVYQHGKCFIFVNFKTFCEAFVAEIYLKLKLILRNIIPHNELVQSEN